MAGNCQKRTTKTKKVRYYRNKHNSAEEWLNCTNGGPVDDPEIVITNLNTSGVFIAETDASSNYYQVMTSSFNMSAGDVLHFNETKDNTTEFDHTVTQADMCAGGSLHRTSPSSVQAPAAM